MNLFHFFLYSLIHSAVMIFIKYNMLMELQTKIDEENQVQESLLERMMETELELEEMETSESAFVRRQERY